MTKKTTSNVPAEEAWQRTQRKRKFLVGISVTETGHYTAQCERFPECQGTGVNQAVAMAKVELVLRALLETTKEYQENPCEIELLAVDLDKGSQIDSINLSKAEPQGDMLLKAEEWELNHPSPEPLHKASFNENGLAELQALRESILIDRANFNADETADQANRALSKLQLHAKDGDQKAFAYLVNMMLQLCDEVSKNEKRFLETIRLIARSKPAWPILKSSLPSFNHDTKSELKRLEVGKDFPIKAKTNILATSAGRAAWSIFNEIEEHRTNSLVHWLLENDYPNKWQAMARNLSPLGKENVLTWWSVIQEYLKAVYPKPGDLTKAFNQTSLKRSSQHALRSADSSLRRAIRQSLRGIAGFYNTGRMRKGHKKCKSYWDGISDKTPDESLNEIYEKGAHRDF